MKMKINFIIKGNIIIHFSRILKVTLTIILSFRHKRNKFMSDFKSKNITFNSMVENWYLENKEKF